MRRKAHYVIFSAILVCWYHAAIGQVASGGGYTLDQTVIANGGASSSGANFAVIGTGGQSIAGTQSNAGNFGGPPGTVGCLGCRTETSSRNASRGGKKRASSRGVRPESCLRTRSDARLCQASSS